MTETRIRPHLTAAFVALVALLLYARTVGYEYVWDDLMYLKGYSQYQGVEGVLRAVTEPFYIYSHYYRPLAVFSFVVSNEPSVQHGINVALHTVNAVLVVCVARALMPKGVADSKTGLVAACIGALLFAVHPVAVEPTVWVSGRFDTLMCSFVLGTCLAALDGELTRRRLALIFMLFACAMGSKESAIGLPVAVLFLLLLKWRLAGMEAAQIKAQAGVLLRVLAALALALALYIAVRLVVVQVLFAGDAVTFSSDSLLDKLNVAALAVSAFFWLIVMPMSHSAPMHPFPYEMGSGVLVNTLIVVLCVLALLAAVFLKKLRLNFPIALLAALAMGWPVFHLIYIPNQENIISDRYVLAPLALLLASLAATAGAWIVRKVPEMGCGGRRIPLYAVVASLLWAGALGSYSNVTIPLWRDEITLWAFSYQRAPESLGAHKSYVNTLMMQGRWSEAGEELNSLLAKHPKQIEKMGIIDITMWMQILAKTGDYHGARELAGMVESSGDDALDSIRPRELGVFYGTRGLIEMDAGNWQQAESYFAKAVKTSLKDVRLSFLYAQALHMTGQAKRSDEVFKKALALADNETAAKEVKRRELWLRQAPVPHSQAIMKHEIHD